MGTRPFNIDVELDLGKLYESNTEQTRFTLAFYKVLYDLPTVIHQDDVTPELFAYCQRRDFFVNVLAYSRDRIFLRRAIGPTLGWELPGSAIKSRGNETVQDAALRIIKRDIETIDIGELRPIAYIEKTYHCRGVSVTHHGITFLGRARHVTPEAIIRDETIKGRFVRLTDELEFARISSPDQKICSLAIPFISNNPDAHMSIERELQSTEQVSWLARVLDRYVLRPIGRRFCSRKIKREILRQLGAHEYFLDVACGDDPFIFDISKIARFCVGNDVHWPQIKILLEMMGRPKTVIFTNHDACDLAFKKQFDVTLCKNLLHHVPARVQLESLLRSLRKVSRRIVIVDPEDPRSSGIKARMWHHWYVRYMKDQGERFFSFNQFSALLKEFYHDADVKCYKLETLKGHFMFAIITLN
jgi:SAM-dependent methyltransferase